MGFAAVAGAAGRFSVGTGRFAPLKLPEELRELEASAGATQIPKAMAAARVGATNFLVEKRTVGVNMSGTFLLEAGRESGGKLEGSTENSVPFT